MTTSIVKIIYFYLPFMISIRAFSFKTMNGRYSYSTQSSTKLNAAKSNFNTLSVLCLHGKGNSGDTFKKILHPLEVRLKSKMKHCEVEFDYLNAPFQMQEDNVEKLQWWKMPPGVRSFNALEYEGFEETSVLVRDTMLSKNYDIVIGHSQGAILLSALFSSKKWTENVLRERNDSEICKLKGLVLNGCAWPNPFSSQMETFNSMQIKVEQDQNTSYVPKMLFIIGEADKINPPESAEKVRYAFSKGGVDVTSCYHERGHAVPVDNEKALESIVDWISTLL